MHSSPYPEPPRLSARSGPVLLPPRPRSTSVPPIPITVQKVAKRYMPITENVTPPISPARTSALEPEAPPPTPRPGRSRDPGKWRAPQLTSPGVGTRSQTRQAELEAAEATLAQASHAMWPQQPDRPLQIQRMTCNLQLRDRSQDTFREIERTLPIHKIDENQNEVSTPVNMATLGLIHRVDPSFAVQLREDPASLAVRATRLKLYSTMRLIRTGMLGQLASLQQWEEAMHAQEGQ